MQLPSPAVVPPTKVAIRASLRASTLDGVFATIFSNIAGGVLLNNFLVELGASPTQFGLLSSIPMLANLLQPLGAYLADRTKSRALYSLLIYGPSRLLWLVLVLGIAAFSFGKVEPQHLITWTLAIIFVTHFLGAFGSASWMSWLAVLVPRRLRGRYFGFRTGAASLTNLISIPVAGMAVSHWPGGTIQGYGVLLMLGVITGLISLGFQTLMVDVNPQTQHQLLQPQIEACALSATSEACARFQSEQAQQEKNFWRFLIYFSFWMFAVNLSAPFFNLYLLNDLKLDISWVTLYTSLTAGANLLMLVFWGRVVDRVGNRPIILSIGLLVALTPILWLGVGSDAWSVYLWLPLLHILAGGTWAAIDLCNNNLQLEVAPLRHQAKYFAIVAAIAGVSGALGTTAGGFLAQISGGGGLLGLFALSGVMRLLALLPLLFVQEQNHQPLWPWLGNWWPRRVVSIP